MDIYTEAFVYKWTNLTNGNIYIGYHKGTTDDGYVCSSKSQRFWNDFADISQPFDREIIAYGTCEDMIRLERELLLEVDINSESVYNNSVVGIIFTDEVKQKMSAAARRKKLSDEHKRKISDAGKERKHSAITKEKMSNNMLGSKNPMYQKDFSAEHRRKLSEAMKRRPPREVSEEARLNMSLAQKGKKRLHSEEHRANLSKALRGIIWITNGEEVRGVHKDDLIPDGWVRGRPKNAKSTK